MKRNAVLQLFKINKVCLEVQNMNRSDYQSYQNQTFIGYEQIMLISFQKKRKMFASQRLCNSKECLIFAGSYRLDKMKTALENNESNQLNY